ncbi:MAG: malto-oligosyltrehalose synthase [Luteitalea sp.]|nr:malto-oligosyltrehalose synthase [Luteitalea sp.]
MSTYRLQMSAAFTFSDTRALVPYLARLGVGACYASPFLMARPGSPHGYDICDHNRLNPDLGSDADFVALVRTLDTYGLLLVLDFVPNHMGVDPVWNMWWREVLENGPCSLYARFFDIDWDPVMPEMKNKVLLPILGEQYGAVLERGELTLAMKDGQLSVRYYHHQLPINPRQQPIVLRHRLDELEATMGTDDPHLREFLSILTGLQNLPCYTDTAPASIEERHREKEVLRARLAQLLDASAPIRAHVDQALAAANGVPGQAESFDTLHLLLEQQPYRLAYWRTAQHEINYRRFFDINELAGVRVEDPFVFEATHALLARLLAHNQVHGLRIDHPDGLFDPAAYFAHVQALARREPTSPSDNGRTALDSKHPIWVIGEKILSHHETLPREWSVHGTTGYNFLNDVNGLFVKFDGFRSLRRIYVRVTGRSLPFTEVAYKSKKLIIETTMASELNVLVHTLSHIAQSSRRSRDFTLSSLREMLTEVVACFPVYRTYVSHEGWSSGDRAMTDQAITEARRRNPAMERSLFDFLRAVLLPERDDDLAPLASHLEPPRRPFASVDDEDYARRITFAMKFQQYTGPVQAKGLEDTAFYRYNVLVSVNEVGGDPARPVRTPEEFHGANLHRLTTWPYEMVTTATHDTKLGEDVRARLNVLSEVPEAWRAELSRWTRLTAGARLQCDNDWAPSRNDEYRFYQALLGIWPPDLGSESPAPAPLVERLREYMLKAVHEAKLHTSWINPNQAYDEAIATFVDRVLTASTSQRFLPAFVPFAHKLARVGAVNSLAQVLLRLTSPGVPDLYQGTELWDLSLVDPDNRGPVDYELRHALLDEVETLACDAALAPVVEDTLAVAAAHTEGSGVTGQGSGHVTPRPLPASERTARLAELFSNWTDGRVKLLLTLVGQRLRQAHPDLFLDGDYTPLSCDVMVLSDLVAFARRRDERVVLTIVPRFIASMMWDDPARWPVGIGTWATSRVLLPPELAALRYRNVLSGQDVAVIDHSQESWIFAGEALKDFPVALLWGER